MILLISMPVLACGSEQYRLYKDTRSYVLSKLRSGNVVFLGTTHKKPTLLGFIAHLISQLHASGVTYLGLEIASDEHENIDRYMATGTGLSDIHIPSPIDCPEHQNLLVRLHQLGQSQRPAVIPLDLPQSMWKGKASRDEWMANRIADVFKTNPEAKMLVVLGALHVLKQIRWEGHVLKKSKSVYGCLKEAVPELKVFSIAQLIDEDPAECDFSREFGPIKGAVAVDCNEGFAEWKIAVQFDIAIEPTQTCELVDGVIIY